jgi:drug/metabolite transporter (DMT)-like permease
MEAKERRDAPEIKRKYLAYGALTLAAVIFGFSFLFTKKTLEHLEMFQLLGLRFLAAAAGMTLLVAARAVKVRYDRRKILSILAVSLMQPIVYFICETFGIKLTSASESGMMIALIPIAVAVFSVMILKERITPKQWIAILAAVAGVFLITAAKGAEQNASHAAGYLLLMGAVLAGGLFTSLSRRASARCTAFEITFAMMWTGALVFNAIGLTVAGTEGRIGRYFTDALTSDAWYGILYLGVLSSIVAFFCLNFAYSRIKSSVSAGFANLTTVISVLAGVAFNGEKLYWLQLGGAVLVLLGIWGVTKFGAFKAGQDETGVSAEEP